MKSTLRNRIATVIRRANGDPELAARALCLTLDGFGPSDVATELHLYGNGFLDNDPEMLALRDDYITAAKQTPATIELESAVRNYEALAKVAPEEYSPWPRPPISVRAWMFRLFARKNRR